MESNKISESLKYINTECSPSHLFNNLSLTDKSIMYIHNSEAQPRVIVVDKKLLHENESIQTYVNKLNGSETNEMIYVRCVFLQGMYYVAVGLYGGFKLWSSDGNRLLFNIPSKVRTTEKPYAFTSISEYKVNSKVTGYDSLICGDNYGQIFLVTGSSQNWRAKLLYSYDGVTTTAITSGLNTDLICVGFETGEVYLLRLKNDNLVEVAAKLDAGNNLPCLVMGVIDNKIKSVLAVGYVNGEVKLYNLSSNSFELLFSISAHIRNINSLTTYNNYLVTSGDDCYVNIWKLNNEDNISITASYELNDKMPVGVAISENKDGTVDLIACCYDNTSLALAEGLKLD
jgi:WD40 repeat protein